MHLSYSAIFSFVSCSLPTTRHIPPNAPNFLFPFREMPDGAICRRAIRVPRSSASRGLRSVRGVDARSTAAGRTPWSTWTITRICARSCSGSAIAPGAGSEQRSGALSAAWRHIADRSTCGSTGRRTRACAGSCARFARQARRRIDRESVDRHASCHVMSSHVISCNVIV